MWPDRAGERGGPVSVGRSLDRLLGSLSRPSVDVVRATFQRWPEVVGPDLAARCRPVSLDGDVLVVEVDDTAWAEELRWLADELLARLAEVSGSDRVRSLRVRVARR